MNYLKFRVKELVVNPTVPQHVSFRVTGSSKIIDAGKEVVIIYGTIPVGKSPAVNARMWIRQDGRVTLGVDVEDLTVESQEM